MRPWQCLAVVSLLSSASVLRADAIPYNNYGHVAPTVPLTATATGDVVGYFVGASAGGTDYVRLVDTTSGYVSKFLLDNQSSALGSSVDFGSVSGGDGLVFQIVNSDVEGNKDGTDFGAPPMPFDPNAQVNGYVMGSDPAYSFDGYNHAYVTSYSGNAALGVPAGTFLGMEDLPYPAFDLDYNDVEFVFTDVSAAAVTPEPDSALLLGTGALALAFGIRRRFAMQ